MLHTGYALEKTHKDIYGHFPSSSNTETEHSATSMSYAMMLTLHADMARSWCLDMWFNTTLDDSGKVAFR